ncbi:MULTISPECIES: hypothetical protein [Mycolicibacterium]|uniref:Uncharacterized protein n=2 Tax=Mycolicibacterium gilvum TaxID=1804 RepID=E6TN31_MYCSR|nr:MULTISPECIES: hypothetical protein [Mycolicibacterium]ADT99389.1 hypothetical protein Mspyr1_27600 [Mycolicibacterium gilvum Spyr1]MBV5246216.1 hypothetical protein [Mycolicibacterium sp. PAM1]MCV7058821.1 hypothetical protein [Mycolicibacterium gilvum]STZ43708.1 Uncharacterised protein [Mycolicibacterium gilvum]
MNKLVVLSGGFIAAGSVALLGAGAAISQPQPGAAAHPSNVVGEQYGRALAILKSQGIKAFFGGSTGSVLPQSACLVGSQKVTSGGRMLLMLDCTQEAADQIKAMGPTGGPTVGANGVTTVTPTPLVPIAGAPGAGVAPPQPGIVQSVPQGGGAPIIANTSPRP